MIVQIEKNSPRSARFFKCTQHHPIILLHVLIVITFMFNLAVISLGQISCAGESKGDVRRDDLQRRFLAQHSVAMLEQRLNHSKQCRNAVLR